MTSSISLMPPSIKKHLLPHNELSVLDFLKFTLPVTARTRVTNPNKYLSATDALTLTSLNDIKKAPIPPATVLDEMLQVPALKTAKSVMCPHAPALSSARLPLWVIDYWSNVTTLRQIRVKWARAQDSIMLYSQQNTSKEARNLVTEVSHGLATLCWSGKVRGFPASVDIELLSVYLTDQWLSDEQENQMLHLLEQDLQQKVLSDGLSFVTTFFVTKLIDIYTKDRANYQTKKNYAWIRNKGDGLFSGAVTQLATLVHVGDNHWVALVIEGEQQRICYGDSLGNEIDMSLKEVLTWWITEHIGHSFTIVALPATRQRDNYSCGILSWNSLASYLAPEVYSLFDPDSVVTERMKMFLRVTHHHYEQASSVSPPSTPPPRLSTLPQKSPLPFSSPPASSPPPPCLSLPASSPPPLPPCSSPPGSSPPPLPCSSPPIGSSPLPASSPLPHSSPLRLPKESTSLLSPQGSPDSGSEWAPSITSSPTRGRNDTAIDDRESEHSEESESEDVPLTTKAEPTTKRKRVTSSIRMALENAEDGGPKKGLLGFFSKGTAEDVKTYWAREEERVQPFAEEQEVLLRDAATRKKEHERDLARARQQKRRALLKESEIKQGVRAPSGKKRKITDVELNDIADPALKRIKDNLAEITRPAREIKAQAKEDSRKHSQGRKQKPENAKRPAKYHDWLTSLLWPHIAAAAKAVPKMSASGIAKRLRATQPTLFSNITHQTIGEWIDRTGDRPKWKDSVLKRVEAGKGPGHNKGGKRGILANHPSVVKAITEQLEFLRESGASINLLIARATVVSTTLHLAPEVFEHTFKDGSKFRASDSFVQKFVHSEMRWTMRHATQAAQKLPKNWEEQCEKSFFRKAYSIKEHDIPIELYVNSDQTQVVYSPSSRMTYAPTGSKQVGVVGMDDKRAFTLMVSVCADGTLLPFQAIYQGHTKNSLPKPNCTGYEAATAAGFRLVSSGTKTYWSNHETMHDFVTNILAPYFDKRKTELGLPHSQHSLWQIDVWSVHRSIEFRTWMKTNHPNIILDYVPGGCTGVHQPCDVGIQRPLKQSIRKSYHEDVVQEFLDKRKEGNLSPSLNDSLGVIRDRSVQWLVNAFEAVNKKDLVQSAFERCVVGKWNLSYTCLTSFEARQALRSLKHSDPAFWKELDMYSGCLLPTKAADNVLEDIQPDNNDDDADDSSIPVSTVIDAVIGKKRTGDTVATNAAGCLVPVTEAEIPESDLHRDPQATGEDSGAALASGEPGRTSRSGRVLKPNQRYKSRRFWRHYDEDEEADHEEEDGTLTK